MTTKRLFNASEMKLSHNIIIIIIIIMIMSNGVIVYCGWQVNITFWIHNAVVGKCFAHAVLYVQLLYRHHKHNNRFPCMSNN